VFISGIKWFFFTTRWICFESQFWHQVILASSRSHCGGSNRGHSYHIQRQLPPHQLKFVRGIIWPLLLQLNSYHTQELTNWILITCLSTQISYHLDKKKWTNSLTICCLLIFHPTLKWTNSLTLSIPSPFSLHFPLFVSLALHYLFTQSLVSLVFFDFYSFSLPSLLIF
jgi:hypothetical protein